MLATFPGPRLATDWANTPTLGATEGACGPLKLNRKPFGDQFPKVKSPIQLTSFQKASLIQNPALNGILPNELELALSRIANEHYVNPIYVGQLVNQIVCAWRLEVLPATSGPMREEDRKAANRKSDELAARKLLEGSEALAKADAATEAARKAQEIAIEQRRAIEALWFELSGLPVKIELAKSRLAAVNNERAGLSNAQMEAAYQELYTATFTGSTASGDLDRLWAQLMQIDRKKALLDAVEKKLTAEVDKLTAREKVLRKELK